MAKDERVDALVEAIDRFMAGGGGHMNVRAEGDGDEMRIQPTNTSVCAPGNMACQTPTLHEGLDRDEFESDSEF